MNGTTGVKTRPSRQSTGGGLSTVGQRPIKFPKQLYTKQQGAGQASHHNVGRSVNDSPYAASQRSVPWNKTSEPQKEGTNYDGVKTKEY